jgi:GTP-binding protein Era
MKAAFVALVGRPSSGKSTFLNRVCGGKVSIVSPVPQTTRNRIRGIHNGPSGQLVFVDTPGFHSSERKMNLRLRELTLSTLRESELVLYLVDVTRPPGEEERALISSLRQSEDRLVVGLNKIDVQPNQRALAEKELAAAFRSPRLFPLSALSGEGLEALLPALWQLAPEGDPMYPPEYYTDQTPEFRIAEIVREKAMRDLREEVPHALYVHIEDLEMRHENTELWARGFLFVERDSQKGILVGRGGERIKATVRDAEAELGELFPYAVKLDLRVKVRPKWRHDEALLSRLIR